MADPVLSEEIPGTDEYIALRAASGMGARTPEAAARGLPNSLHSVCLRDGARLVGMGRVVGDGGSFCELVDVAIHPDWQGRGLGHLVVENLMRWCDAHLPQTCYLSLMATARAVTLYERFGFEARPTDAPGMAQYIRADRP